MSDIKERLKEYQKEKIALYGLGTETERFLSAFGNSISIVGLLDGFHENGTMYGYPILPVSEILLKGVRLIVVIARPGSCKAIVKRIGAFCQENGVALYDVRGRNLLENRKVSYDIKHLKGKTLQELSDKIDRADIISFDLFDTLVMRKVYSYIDIFELLDVRLRKNGIYIPDFAQIRLFAEKELSKDKSPRLEQVYEYVLKESGGNFITASELAFMEWEIDFSVMIARKRVCDIFRQVISSGKTVVIVTDSYYSLEQIKEILNRFHLADCDKIFVSCEYKTSKTQGLFKILQDEYKDYEKHDIEKKLSILHIGDDEFSDIEKALENSIDSYRIFSGEDLFDAFCGQEIESCLLTIADRLKVGMFVSHIFNHPFWFEDEDCVVSVEDAFEIGYLFCAPMITDFVLWMRKNICTQSFRQILFCARDGYLIGKLFRKISPETRSIYFLSSRTAAIRAGVEDEQDIEYVDSMGYFGTLEESLQTRYGITVDDLKTRTVNEEILIKANHQRTYYRQYIKKLDIQDEHVAMFDFVAKGTTQMYLQKLFSQHIKGFYFLQLEPEFMADKGLDIQPYYLDEEKNTSAVFEHYYILETILTSPYAQVEEFDEDGTPVFAVETRSEKDIRCFERAQNGIIAYVDDYLNILPEEERKGNKELDELFLSFVSKLQINDEAFLALNVEDPFFGRMTKVRDIIGEV